MLRKRINELGQKEYVNEFSGEVVEPVYAGHPDIDRVRRKEARANARKFNRKRAAKLKEKIEEENGRQSKAKDRKKQTASRHEEKGKTDKKVQKQGKSFMSRILGRKT